jgi:single stranded DNA-binding protein
MAGSYNRFVTLARLTRDPEIKTFANGGKVAKLGLAFAGQRKKDQHTGKWEDEPCFLDAEVFNRGEHGKMADIAEQYLTKGKQALFEGRLRMDTWSDKDGKSRSKHLLMVDTFQLVGPKEVAPPHQDGEREADPFASTPNRYQPKTVGQQYRDKSLDNNDVTPQYAPDPANRDDIPF